MTTNRFASHVAAQHPRLPARSTQVTTPHGEFSTPCFMPVGTRAVVNHMTVEDLSAAGSQIILGGNTYHMLCRPGMDILKQQGGMHRFMNWQGPMLTDSGGFQVFSLSRNGKLCKIKEDGAHFKHPQTGEKMLLNAVSSIQAQKVIGADIIMAFDQCTPEAGGREAATAALERTHRWLGESINEHQKNTQSAYGYEQALFGIIQGGSFPDLREQSAKFIVDANLDGIGIGGEAIGFDMAKTAEIADWLRPMLPENKVRYTMGVGLKPQDLIDVVARGIDIFDCVAPTRNARHGSLYYGHTVLTDDWVRFDPLNEKGKIAIKKAEYANDERPVLKNCGCYTCQHYSRSYLHYLYKENMSVYYQLASIHNIHVMHDTCAKMRQAITDVNHQSTT